MNRRRWVLPAAIAGVTVIVAAQVVSQHFSCPAGGASAPTVRPGSDILAGVDVVDARVRGSDYRRGAFGGAWDDDNSAPGGRNGCDTRDEILARDLIDKTYVSTKRCPQAVSGGTLRDPYTNATVPFIRGNQVGASVQIDHIVPLAFAWDMGARDWTDGMRKRFANDPANLIAVAGQANHDKGDHAPGEWMPPNHAFWCQYAVQFAEVLRGYRLAVDENSAQTLRDATRTCPAG